jgi:two-component system, OmpR family, sensor histidine kinase ChvG
VSGPARVAADKAKPVGKSTGKTMGTRGREADVVLGEDWVAPALAPDTELRRRRQRRSLIAINRSPLARKIIIFNLLAIIVLVGGVLWMNPVRDSLVVQREAGLVEVAHLVADVFEAQLPQGAPVNLMTGDGVDAHATLGRLDLTPSIEVYVFDRAENLVATTLGRERRPFPQAKGAASDQRSTLITGILNRVWEALEGLVAAGNRPEAERFNGEVLTRALLPEALTGSTQVNTGQDTAGRTVFSVATPIVHGGQVVGVVAVTSATGEIDQLVRAEREQVLQMFVIAILVSIGLSLVLASTIANPIADLAAAAEIGSEKNARKMSPGRVRIPDLSGRPDEIGRLSAALRGMVAALYDRIEANEQFAADVAHEIKNPLASLRSAIGTLRFAKRDDQRERLFEVIEHDVRRLDRLVSDISNASRLDSELVKEDEAAFNLLKMLSNITDFMGNEAHQKGVEFITDLPKDPIVITGLEARLAQVFVNLISNAISFCEEGDAIRIWARRREDRVIVVVEDTGPGIPEAALTKIFNRFYSERPQNQFGNNSGLGLAISKQIVEAHGGVIWAENIRPTDADISSDPLGARFVVGLPL